VAVKGDTIYLSTIAYVYAIDRQTGQQKYKYFSEAYYYTSPVIDASGVIYVGSITTIQSSPVNQGILHALTDTGSALISSWSYPVDNGTGRLAPPVLGANRTLYVSSTANKIYAIE
jgi:outer membrane protein assembly factor BamB